MTIRQRLGSLSFLAVLFFIAGCGGATSQASFKTTDEVGITPQLEPVAANWVAIPAIAEGIVLKYPPDWQLDQPAANLVILRQPSSQSGSPAPIIAVSFEPGVTVDQPASSDGLSPATPITIAGLQGWEYHQVGLTTPSSSDFIVLPYGGGRLQITATQGPSANLVPQAQEILKTLEVAP